MCAPQPAGARARTCSVVAARPPSLKLSGVTLQMPISHVRLPQETRDPLGPRAVTRLRSALPTNDSPPSAHHVCTTHAHNHPGRGVCCVSTTHERSRIHPAFRAAEGVGNATKRSQRQGNTWDLVNENMQAMAAGGVVVVVTCLARISGCMARVLSMAPGAAADGGDDVVQPSPLPLRHARSAAGATLLSCLAGL